MSSSTLDIPAVAAPNAEPDSAVKRSRWGWLYPLLSILAGTTAIGIHGSRFGNWVVDDAGITFAYARSVAQGLGPIVQPGAPPVEGFSDPTWMVLLALGRVVGLFDHGTIFGIADYALFPKALALVCCAGILLAIYLVAKQVTRRPALITLICGLILAAIPSFVIWCFSGLENSLFALAVVWLAAVLFLGTINKRMLTTKVAIWTGAIVAFAALTRPEGAIYVAAYPLLLLIQLRSENLRASIRYTLISIATFAVPFGAYLIWRFLEFGRLLSNPAIAKAQRVPGPEDFLRSGELVSYAGALAVIILLLLIGTTLVRPSKLRDGVVALLVPLGLAIIAYSALAGDWMSQHRFATPVWPLAALVGLLVATDALRRSRKHLRVVLTLGLIVSLIPSAFGFATASEQFEKNPTIPMCDIADRLGRAFNEYADIAGLQQASFLVPDLGGSALTSRLTLVDMAGLTEKKIADFINQNDMAGLRDYVFDEVKPTFIHSRGPWTPANRIPLDPRMERDYVDIYLYPNQPPGLPSGDWIRRDALRDPATLEKLRTYAYTKMVEVDLLRGNWLLRQCGPLRLGDTTLHRL